MIQPKQLSADDQPLVRAPNDGSLARYFSQVINHLVMAAATQPLQLPSSSTALSGADQGYLLARRRIGSATVVSVNKHPKAPGWRRSHSDLIGRTPAEVVIPANDDRIGARSSFEQAPGTQNAVPPPPMSRDKRGWNVAPAPDGRGMPEEQRRRPLHRRYGLWIIVFVLLALNWTALLMSKPAGQARVGVPFSPYFLGQVRAGDVKSISSKGDTIQGVFATKTRYPQSDRRATPTTLFSTQVPSFWNDTALTELLQSKGVQVNAQSTATSSSLVEELLLGFGPVLLLVGLFVLLARRASAASGAGALGSFGRTQARPRGSTEDHRDIRRCRGN